MRGTLYEVSQVLLCVLLNVLKASIQIQSIYILVCQGTMYFAAVDDDHYRHKMGLDKGECWGQVTVFEY